MNDDIWSYNFIDQAMKEKTYDTSQYESYFYGVEKESFKSIKDTMMDQMSKNMDEARREREIRTMKNKWYNGTYSHFLSFSSMRVVRNDP